MLLRHNPPCVIDPPQPAEDSAGGTTLARLTSCVFSPADAFAFAFRTLASIASSLHTHSIETQTAKQGTS